MAYRVVNEVDASSTSTDDRAVQTKDSSSVKTGAGTAGNGSRNNGGKMDEDEERDAVFFRLESLGYRVGQGLVERYVYSGLSFTT